MKNLFGLVVMSACLAACGYSGPTESTVKAAQLVELKTNGLTEKQLSDAATDEVRDLKCAPVAEDDTEVLCRFSFNSLQKSMRFSRTGSAPWRVSKSGKG
jgi:hypothetical protein